MSTPKERLAALIEEAIPLVLKHHEGTDQVGTAEERITNAIATAQEYHRIHPLEDGFGELAVPEDMHSVVLKVRAEHEVEHKKSMADPFVEIGIPRSHALKMVEAILEP